MELAHSLLLNDEALKEISDNKKPIFIYEWLRFLQKVLSAAQKTDIKEKQNKLIEQLTGQILTGPGPPTRQLIGKCLTLVYIVSGGYTSYVTVNKCNEIARSKDDSPSYLQIRLAAIDCLGSLYEDLGRMLGNVMQETVHILVKGLKNAESQTRAATIDTLRRIMVGLGTSASICHRDIYKCSKIAIIDRSMHVRATGAECLRQLAKESTFVYFSEYESLCNQCIRSLEGSSYEVRCDVAKLLGYLACESQKVKPSNSKEKKLSLIDVLNTLMHGFIQGGSSKSLVSRDKQGSANPVRIGITMAYVEMARCSGPQWLEKNLAVFIKHTLVLVLNPKCVSMHVEAVYSRRCVSYILRSTLGKLLGEKQQRTAAKELCNIISLHMNSVDTALSDNNSGNSSVDATLNQHLLVCALNELGCLVQSLGTSAAPLVAEAQSNILQPVVGVLLHPTQCTRLSAAWCLRCIATAIPSQLTPLIDKCAARIRNMKSSREAVSGYSSALAALLGAVSESSMGIPHSKGSVVFGVAEELLRTAGKSGRLALCKTQAGWILLGSLMILGPSLVRHHLTRLLQLWKSAFPRSMRELEQERQKGDSFTWQLTLEARSGALCAMRSFVANCGELLTDDVTRKLMVPLESAMAMMGIIPYIINTHGLHLKASTAMVRLRLYDILALLPPKSYEGSFHALLRELVAEFTLTDNPANTTTSLLRSLCHQDDSMLLGYWLQDTDQSFIEDQLQDNSVSGSGSLEHDATSVYLPAPQGNVVPGPLPLGVSVIDAAIALFGLAFSHVAQKHRIQMLRHFGECVKQSVKNAARQRAIQINVFTALICALKGLSENKLTLGKGEIINAATALVLEALASTDSVLRCAAGEAVGRMAQVADEAGFVSKIALMCFEKLKTARDVISRTGHSLALGCVHRYVGGMGAAQHLRTSVGILLALAQDHNSPEVQVWALHALALIVDAFGPMFRTYVEPTLQALVSLLLTVPLNHANVHRCLGRCLSALITTLGPELQGTSSAISVARSSCLTCCSIMSRQNDAQVQAESISCLQQLHMFAPRHVELSSLVPTLCTLLSSWHLVLRRSAVSCLRQLAQKEAEEVCEIASRLNRTELDANEYSVQITDTGLEGTLFKILDREVDIQLRSDAKDTFNHILQSTALKKLGFWLALCKSVLASSSDSAALGSVDAHQPDVKDDNDDDDDDEDGGDDGETFAPVSSTASAETQSKILPRWPTRVFAMQSVQKITMLCQQTSFHTAHFDLIKARDMIKHKSNAAIKTECVQNKSS